MSESKWDWMKRNQRRFAAPSENQRNSLPVSQMLPSSSHSLQKPTGQMQQNLLEKTKNKSPHHTLDAFIKPESALFDETFSREDFRLLTKRWKAEQDIVN